MHSINSPMTSWWQHHRNYSKKILNNQWTTQIRAKKGNIFAQVIDSHWFTLYYDKVNTEYICVLQRKICFIKQYTMHYLHIYIVKINTVKVKSDNAQAQCLLLWRVSFLGVHKSQIHVLYLNVSVNDTEHDRILGFQHVTYTNRKLSNDTEIKIWARYVNVQCNWHISCSVNFNLLIGQ